MVKSDSNSSTRAYILLYTNICTCTSRSTDEELSIRVRSPCPNSLRAPRSDVYFKLIHPHFSLRAWMGDYRGWTQGTSRILLASSSIQGSHNLSPARKRRTQTKRPFLVSESKQCCDSVIRGLAVVWVKKGSKWFKSRGRKLMCKARKLLLRGKHLS